MSRKKREGVVYSTNPDFNFTGGEESREPTLPPDRQLLFVWLEAKGRKGKTVTLVKGFVGYPEDMEDLAKELKKLCGSGGTVKDGEILIQGNFREKVVTWLTNKGYKVKKAGG